MPINLTTPQTLTNGTRVTITGVKYHEDEKEISYSASLRTAAGGTPADAEISSVRAGIREGFSDQVSRVTLLAGSHVSRLLMSEGSKLPTDATAFAAAVTAFKTSKAAFEAHLLSAQYLHSSLAGT